MKQNFLGYLLTIIFPGKHTLNLLGLTKLSLLCYVCMYVCMYAIYFP